MPEYTLSLSIWIAPIILYSILFIRNRLLTPEKSFALFVTVAALAAVGFVLDLLFAHAFFTFPDPAMTTGIRIRGIPVEEFVFYITGFWFIIFTYVFCDEWFLKKYNRPDAHYVRYRSHLKRLIFIHRRSVYWLLAFLACGLVVKRVLLPEGVIPGYFFFLSLVAYVPMILFYRVTRSYVNWQAFWFTLLMTSLISVIWEVTLALPRGYWGYRNEQMLGVLIGFWNDLPLEAVSVWVFSTLVILIYEFLKICYFTPVPCVPQYDLWMKIGNGEARAGRPRSPDGVKPGANDPLEKPLHS